MKTQDLHELATPYALDALDADARDEFEAHLPGCERCRAELAGLSETVGALALAAEGPAPDGALREKILTAARQEAPPNVIALRPRRTRLYAGSALAAAACAAIAIGLWAGLSGNSGAMTRIALRSSSGAPVNGTLIVRNSGRSDLTVSDLAAAPAGKAYEIWVITEGAVLPAGLFTGGAGKVVVPLRVPVFAGALVAVTLERAGGVTRPTTKVLYAARMAA